MTKHSPAPANGACDPVMGVELSSLLFLRVTFRKTLKCVTVSSFSFELWKFMIMINISPLTVYEIGQGQSRISGIRLLQYNTQ